MKKDWCDAQTTWSVKTLLLLRFGGKLGVPRGEDGFSGAIATVCSEGNYKLPNYK